MQNSEFTGNFPTANRRPGLRIRTLGLAVAMAAGLPGICYADAASAPPFSLSADLSERVDSNVTRQPEGPNVVSSRIDRQALTGAFEETSGQSRLYASALIAHDNYQALPILNTTTEDLHGGWSARLGRGIDTDIHISRSSALANLADQNVTSVGSIVHNVITRDSLGGYLHVPFTRHWDFVATADTSRSYNSNALDEALNTQGVYLGAGASLLVNNDENVGVLLRNGKTHFPSSGAASIGLSDTLDQFADLNVHLRPTGASAINGRLGFQRHTYSSLSYRNSAGPSYNLSWFWTPGGHLSLLLLGERILGGPADNQFLSGVITRFRIEPSYALTSKIKVSVHYEDQRSDYNANLQLLQVGQTPQQNRSDHGTNAGINLMWQPRGWLSLNSEFATEHRSSNLAINEYRANVVALHIKASID